MDRSIGKWWDRLQFTLLFLSLTVVAHYAYGWLQTALSPLDPYRVPEGRAEKVFGADGSNAGPASQADRLRLFYWLGE